MRDANWRRGEGDDECDEPYHAQYHADGGRYPVEKRDDTVDGSDPQLNGEYSLLEHLSFLAEGLADRMSVWAVAFVVMSASGYLATSIQGNGAVLAAGVCRQCAQP
jgi:hypothetical protein